MKKYLFCLLFFAVISCNAKPVIVFEGIDYDFGHTITESVLRHTFNFKNTGNSTLIIERIKAG